MERFGGKQEKMKDIFRQAKAHIGLQSQWKKKKKKKQKKKMEKTKEKMKRGSRKRSSSAGSEKMERVGGRQEKMEGRCSTDQSPQLSVVPVEEEEEEEEE